MKEKLAKLRQSRFLLEGLLLIVLGAVSAFVYLKTREYYYVLAILVPTLCLCLYFRNHKANENRRKAKALQEEFTRLFGFYEVYLYNHIPTYASLKRIIPYASKEMKTKLNQLIDSIDEDKSVLPYVDFSNNFDNFAIREVMMNIYLFSEQGEKEGYLDRFSLLFSTFQREELKLTIDRKVSKLGTLTIFPLIGGALEMLMVLSGIMSALGGIING